MVPTAAGPPICRRSDRSQPVNSDAAYVDMEAVKSRVEAALRARSAITLRRRVWGRLGCPPRRACCGKGAGSDWSRSPRHPSVSCGGTA